MRWNAPNIMSCRYQVIFDLKGVFKVGGGCIKQVEGQIQHAVVFYENIEVEVEGCMNRGSEEHLQLLHHL